MWGGGKWFKMKCPMLDKLILIVEDNKMVSDVAAYILKSSGYEVIVKDDYESAIECLSTRTDISLLLTDIILPNGRRGTEIAAFAREKFANLPIIFTSAFSDQHLNFSSSTCTHFIQKPYRAKQLKQTVDNVL